MSKNPSCIGWTNPNNLYYGPVINSLSSYFSPAASTSLVVITGQNFYSWSTVKFGTFFPTVYFINSNILEFYVPTSAAPGTYPIQVFNGSVVSNTKVYTIDNASGYWILNPDGSISPSTNNGGIDVSSVTINNNLIMDGTAGTNYIEFPDGTQQYTAFQQGILDIYTYSFSGITQGPTAIGNHQIISFGTTTPIPVAGTYLITGPILMSGATNGGYEFYLQYGVMPPPLTTITTQIGNIFTSNITGPVSYNLSQIVTLDGTGTDLELIITTGTIVSGSFTFSGTFNFTRLK
uniref:IPT/TIG domain-containing protein n=1 Tax=viral metagenome TaxID=1070528 RepID=A0A6C0ITN4_9ZZZZ